MLDKLTTKEACATVMNDAVFYMMTISCGAFFLAIIAMLLLGIYVNQRLSDINKQIAADGAAIVGMVGLRKNGNG